jgi:signal transduction histidine kinase
MRNRRRLVVGLVGIAGVFVLQALIATLWRSHIDGGGRQIAERAIDSVESVNRIEYDVTLEHALVEQHIFADAPADMARIETRIEQVWDDLDRASATYARLIDTPDEAATWQDSRTRIANLRQNLPEVLALSRANLNAAADTTLARVDGDYAALTISIRDLVANNERDVRRVLDEGVSLETHARTIVLASQLAGLAGLLLVGLWGFRRVAEEQHQLARVHSLEERNRELDAFAGRVAHDLRNPLGTIVFTTETLEQHGNDPRAIERMRRGTRRIQDLINDLLVLSRAGGELGHTTCNLAVISARIGEDFGERFGKDADLRPDVEAATVPYSETLLAQAVWNLVENAVKYRREGVRPEVRVTGRSIGASYELTIADNGLGMSNEEAARAFEPFYRVGQAHGVMGTGLGLAIVKRVVEAHRGTVSVTSRPGEGSTFVLSLPIAGKEPEAS